MWTSFQVSILQISHFAVIAPTLEVSSSVWHGGNLPSKILLNKNLAFADHQDKLVDGCLFSIDIPVAVDCKASSRPGIVFQAICLRLLKNVCFLMPSSWTGWKSQTQHDFILKESIFERGSFLSFTCTCTKCHELCSDLSPFFGTESRSKFNAKARTYIFSFYENVR